MISIIIATHQRPTQLQRCLQSISANIYKHYEVIIIDQSKNKQTQKVVTHFHDPHFIYVHEKKQNKSAALNQGMKKAKGNIFAFTDDDCIVSKNWLTTIQSGFSSYKNVDGMFGSTTPYRQKKHPHAHCVSIYQQKQNSFIFHPCKHSKNIGYGNNMAWRQSVCKNNFFSTWLGPHSIGKNAEDAEFTIRQLIQGKIVFCNKRMLVYHDHWLNKKENQKQNLIYIHAEMACYGYFALLGWKFAKKIICQNFIASARDIKRFFGDIIKRRQYKLDRWAFFFQLFNARIYGYGVGCIYVIQYSLKKLLNKGSQLR